MNKKNFKERSKSNKTTKSNNKTWMKKAKSMAKKDNYQDAFADEERSKDSKYPAPRTKYASNDPQWYFKQQEILNDVASFSFSKPLGTPFYSPLDVKLASGFDVNLSAFNSIPGVMALKLMPTVGVSRDSNSPLNLGAQNIYTRVRYKNSGAANYDAPDLMLYYIAMSSLYSAWNWAKRIYGYASNYSQLNKYLPKAYAALENVDLDDVVANLADYRARLNMLANSINAFCVPAVFNYMVRQSWLYSNIYKDSDTTKAQEYIFTPAAFYKYSEMSSPQGGELTVVDIALTTHSTKFKAADILNVIKSMIDALQYSSDIGNMSGDTLKEFGSNLFTLTLVEPDYRVEPVFSKEVLSQFENCMFLASWGGRVSSTPMSIWNITQDPNTNYLKWEPQWKSATGERQGIAGFLNFHWNNPTPEDVIVASRFNYAVFDEPKPSDANFLVHLKDCGSEIAIACNVAMFSQGSIATGYNVNKPLTLTVYPITSISFGNNQSAASIDAFAQTAISTATTLFLWSAFDWAPGIFNSINVQTTGPSKWYTLPDMRDWDVYTRLDSDDFAALNELALLSMFNVPN